MAACPLALLDSVDDLAFEPWLLRDDLAGPPDEHPPQVTVGRLHASPSPRKLLSWPTARDSSLLTASSLEPLITATSAIGGSRYQCRTSSSRRRCLSLRIARRRSPKAAAESPIGDSGNSGSGCLSTDHQRPRRTSRHSFATMPRNHGFISAPGFT